MWFTASMNDPRSWNRAAPVRVRCLLLILPALVAVAVGPALGQPIFPGPVAGRDGIALNLCVGEFNHDGFPDVLLAVRDYVPYPIPTPVDTTIITVLPSVGDGTLKPNSAGEEVAVGQDLLTVADFNGDGLDDFASAGYARDTVIVELGRPDGAFDGGALAFSGVAAEAMEAADLDGDGNTDLVIGWKGSTIVVVPGLGDGTFGPPRSVFTGAATTDLVVVDLDGDGDLDLATVDGTSPTVTVALNRGDGSFDPTAVHPVGDRPVAIGSGDFDGDGVADLVTANRDSDDLSLLRGLGDGTFEAAKSFATTDSPRHLATADFDGDGRTDVACLGGGYSHVSVHRGLADGTLSPARSYPAGAARAVAVADFDRDGALDLAILFSGDTYGDIEALVTILYGDGTGAFSSEVVIEPGSIVNGTSVGDFDGDGVPDLVTLSGWSLDLHWSRGRGDGTFDDAILVEQQLWAVNVAAGDFDADGNLDLVLLQWGPGGMQVFFGRGDGTFEAGPTLSAPMPYDLVVTDLNDDDLADIVALYQGWRGSVRALLGNGDGTFRQVSDNLVGQDPESLAVGDFDGDGVLDVATANLFSRDVSVLIGRGDGLYESEVRVPSVGYAPSSLGAGDLDGDGRDDLAVHSIRAPWTPQLGELTLLAGYADGAFQKSVWRYGSPGRLGVELADFDLDGDTDVATAAPLVRALRVYFGDGQGDVEPYPGNYCVGGGWYPSHLVAVSDVNTDGRPDLVGASPHAENISILLNRAPFPNEPPVADAGPDQTIECVSPDTTTAELDGSGSYDPDGDDLTFAWSAPGVDFDDPAAVSTMGHFPLAETEVSLTVSDGRDEASDTCSITVVDTTPPEGAISRPLPGSCHGPEALPVTIEDVFVDRCDTELDRVYTPGPGPVYEEHGDYLVTLTVTDDSGNAATDAVAFTIDTVAPQVTILDPAPDGTVVPDSLPFSILFEAEDDDGAAGGVVHEVVELEGCPVYDGAVYGDGDGLLSDETLELGTDELCRAADLCGFSVLVQPKIRVRATDCGGNEGSDVRRLPGSISLRPGVCGP